MDRDDGDFADSDRPDGSDGLPLKFQTASSPRPAARGIRIFTWVILIVVANAILALTVATNAAGQG